MKKSAFDAGISGKNVTNYTARKTTVQTLRNAGFAAENMEKSGHKNMSFIINYSTISDEEQKKMTSALMGGKLSQPGLRCEMPQCSSTSTTGPMLAQHSWVQPKPVTYNHCTVINQSSLSPWQWKVSTASAVSTPSATLQRRRSRHPYSRRVSAKLLSVRRRDDA